MAEKLQLIIEVDDKGTPKLKTLGDEAKKAFDKMMKAPEQAKGSLDSLSAGWVALTAKVAAVTAAIYGVQRAFSSFVNSAAEAEQIENRLRYALETTGYTWQYAKSAVDEFASAVQASTRFSDEQARQALTDMMLYTNNFAKAQMGAKLAMDMSIRTGQDLHSANRLIGMAMSGNVEMLGKYYIPQLKNLEATLGANATMAQKAEYALKILQALFGGAAQADLDTYAGKLKQFQNQLNDIKVLIGTHLLPVLKDVVEWAGKAVNATWLFLGGGTQLQKYQKELQGITEWQEMIEQQMKSYRAMGMKQQIIALMKTFEELEKRRHDILGKIRDLEREQIENQRKLAAETKKDIFLPDPELARKAAEAAKKAADELFQIGIKGMEAIHKEVEEILRLSEMATEEFGAKFGEIQLPEGWKWERKEFFPTKDMLDALDKLEPKLKEFIPDVLRAWGYPRFEWVVSPIETIEEHLTKIADEQEDLWIETTRNIRLAAAEEAKRIAAERIENEKKAEDETRRILLEYTQITGNLQWQKQLQLELLNIEAERLRQLGVNEEAIRRYTRVMIEKIQEAGSFGEVFAENLASAWNFNLKSIISDSENMADALKKIFLGISDAFTSAISRMITNWALFGSITGEYKKGAGLVGMLGSFFTFKEGGVILGGWKPIDAGNAYMRSFQEGGIVRGPTIGLIGEGGRDEAVIPLKGGKVPVEMKNDRGTTNIFYIQAIDAWTFREFVRRNPQAIIEVVANDARSAGPMRSVIRSS